MAEPPMDNPVDLDQPRAIHIIFIGGKAMSAMAEILVAMGHRVSGSDPNDIPVLARLRDLGVAVEVGIDTKLPDNLDLVARSTAVRDDHPEVVAAEARGLPVVGRPALQGAIARTRRTIAVSGTHGKTSTTAMLVHVLERTGRRPSFIVGGDLGGQAGGARWDTGEWFVVEGDESDGTFLQLGAERAVVTNVEADHLDYYGTSAAIEAAFAQFLAQAGTGRIVCGDDPIAARLGQAQGAMTYGTGAASDLRIVEVVENRQSIRFSLEVAGERVATVQLPEPGLHNAQNAAGAIAAAHSVGVPYDEAAAALASYPGVGRRFERRGEAAGVVVIDDYAHNPGKVRAVVAAASHGGWDRVVVVFQPHRFSRTADLWSEFADSFVGADLVVITELDPAGEAPIPGVSGHMIVDAVRGAHPGQELIWHPELADLVPFLVPILKPGDLCLTLGAGTITRLAEDLLPALSHQDR